MFSALSAQLHTLYIHRKKIITRAVPGTQLWWGSWNVLNVLKECMGNKLQKKQNNTHKLPLFTHYKAYMLNIYLLWVSELSQIKFNHSRSGRHTYCRATPLGTPYARLTLVSIASCAVWQWFNLLTQNLLGQALAYFFNTAATKVRRTKVLRLKIYKWY